MSIPTFKLNDGTEIPEIGFGTYHLRGQAGALAVRSALEAGYRYLDSAVNYDNEGAVGAGIKASGVKREDVLVASKLPGRYYHYQDAIKTVEESLYEMGLDYFDLYFVHWPMPKLDLYVEAWQGLIEAQKRGLVKTIGVCNFTEEYLDRLIEETGVTPAVNQVECHPYFQQDEIIAYNKEKGILTQSWSPLGRAAEKMEVSIMDNPLIQSIAKEHGKSPAQVILRWHIQRGTMPIPKSAHKGRQEENLDVFDFELTSDDMDKIKSLDKADGRTGGAPRTFEYM